MPHHTQEEIGIRIKDRETQLRVYDKNLENR